MTATGGGSVADKFNAANKRTTLFCQIETAEGVENADAMAAIDGVDCLWVGHFDLSVSLGIPGQFDHREVQEGDDKTIGPGYEAAQEGSAAGSCPNVEQAGIDIYKRRLRLRLLLRAMSGCSRHALADGIVGTARRLQGEVERRRWLTNSASRYPATSRRQDGSPTYPDFDLGAAADRARRRDGLPRVREPARAPISLRISMR